ncbi:MAG: hypothetical protein ACTSQF_09455 [Candidatus Heimdallarchaeaceae archaeon]
MPDVKDAEKTQIKYIAKRYVQDLANAPMSEGLTIYSKTIDKIFLRSARWKICLQCGTINKREILNENNHSCSSTLGNLPVIIQTSWVRLKDFFLSDEYIKLLDSAGIEPVSVRPTTVSIPVEETAEIPTTALEEASVKAGQEGSDSEN